MADNIKAPSHYVDGREYEPKDVIRDWGLNFNLGSAVKYISRAGRKRDKLEDLKKAKQFLEFEIEAVEKANELDLSKKLFECHVNGVLNGTMYVTDFKEPYQKRIIDRIVERINNGELDCFDISTDLYCGYQDIRDAIARQALRKVGEKQKSDIGMTCKEAAEIGDAMAKGFKEGIKEEEGNSERETDIETERMTCAYAIGILSRVVGFNSIHDEYKPRVIDKIAQKVLDNWYDIVRDIPTDEVRAAVIDRIVEGINNGELKLKDIPTDLYTECSRIRAAFANREYRKTMDALRKYAEKGFKKVKEIDDEDIVRCYADDLLKEIVNMDTIPDEYKDRVIEYIVEMIVSGQLSFRDIPWRLFAYSKRIRNAVYKKYCGDTPFTVSNTITYSFNFEED